MPLVAAGSVEAADTAAVRVRDRMTTDSRTAPAGLEWLCGLTSRPACGCGFRPPDQDYQAKGAQTRKPAQQHGSQAAGVSSSYGHCAVKR